MTSSVPAFLILPILGAGLLAQAITVPAIAPNQLPGDTQYLFACNGTHLQIVVDAPAIGTHGPRPLQQIGVLFGANVQGGFNHTAFELRLGHTPVAPATMTPSFSRNGNGGLGAAQAGFLTVPNPAAADFGMITLAQPFVFDPAQGNLLIDLALPQGFARSLALLPQPLAAVAESGPMSDRWYPGNGVVANDIRSEVSLDPSNGQLSLAHHVDAIPGQLVLMLTGLSAVQHGGVTLPFSLAPIGAPGQWLLAAPQTVTASTGVYVTQCGFPMLRDGVRWNLPLDGRFAHGVYHTQAVVLGGQRSLNRADLSTSDLETVTLGRMTAAPSQTLIGMGTEDVGQFDITSPRSRATSFQSPVVRLEFAAQ
ncbi:MAG: hypothetical protein IPK26_07070 [Planctomycetes bacterium]|nr:hypothetical protein [Planctomycetota bacterium]